MTGHESSDNSGDEHRDNPELEDDLDNPDYDDHRLLVLKTTGDARCH